MPVIVVHRAHCGLRYRESGRNVILWCEYRFLPIPGEESGSELFVKSRAPSVALEVLAPPGARMQIGLGAAEGTEPILVTVDNPKYGFDAASVWSLANKCARGFAVRHPGA